MKKILFIAAVLVSTVCAAKKPIRVVCIGDSITQGATIRDQERDSYPAVLQRLLGDSYTVLNCGKSGTTMMSTGDKPFAKERQYRMALDAMPDIVTIMLGTNDSKTGNWDEAQFRKDYDRMIRVFKALPSHPDIYLCLPPRSYSDAFTIRDSVIAAGVIPIVKAHADHHWFELIDCNTLLEPEHFNDGIHPNEAGAEMIASAIRNTLKENGWPEVPGKKVVFIGDSITDGDWGKADSQPSSKRSHYDFNHLYGHGYAQNCAAYYLSKYPEANYRFYNRGKGGDNLHGISSRWFEDVLSLQPDVVSLLVGINDTNRHTLESFDFADWEKTLRSLVEKTRSFDPDCKLVLCTPFIVKRGAVGRKDNYEERHAIVLKVAEIVRRVASDYGLACVDFAPLVDKMVATDRSGDRNYWMWDGIHPTMQGHVKMSDLWLKTVKKKHIL